ncbi:oxygenase MpaB family protein [Prescottella soli]|uniref:Oxygenase MpaB family protein n=1 Tax=Prescottella soli TaxID=1543852 RepID=A0ABW9FZH3_9NOCA
MPTRYLDLAGSEPRLTNELTRIRIDRSPRRAGRPTRITDALDFWAFAGGAANVVMQLSWPEVGRGVVESKVESGSLFRHPWKRARTTFTYLSVAILGTDDERRAYRAAVNGAHRHVRSDENSPVAYNAFDRELQLWVAACLFVGFEDTHQLLHGKLTPEQAEEFYRSSSTLGTTLQVTEEMWPATRADFDRYWNIACERVAMDDTVRDYLTELIGLRMVAWPLRFAFGDLLKFLTAGFLPPLFRQQLGIEWGDDDRRRFEHLFVFVAFVNRFIPGFVRHLPSRLFMRDLRWRIRSGRSLV